MDGLFPDSVFYFRIVALGMRGGVEPLYRMPGGREAEELLAPACGDAALVVAPSNGLVNFCELH